MRLLIDFNPFFGHVHRVVGKIGKIQIQILARMGHHEIEPPIIFRSVRLDLLRNELRVFAKSQQKTAHFTNQTVNATK